MSVVVVGLQHKQASLSLLEAVAVGDADLHKVLGALRHSRNVQETVVLSTCLRTEVYAVVDRFHDAVAEIYDVVAEHAGLAVAELEEHAVIRFDDDVTRHLFAVASGLESAVMGESEVVGQVRRAFESAQEEGACGPVLSALFQHALQTGKRVRTDTGISRGTTSFAYAAVEVARAQLPDGLADRAGGGGRRRRHGVWASAVRWATWPRPTRPGAWWWSTARWPEPRPWSRTASETGIWRAASLENVHAELAKADVVLTAVAAESHVLAPAHFSGVAGPLLVIDLGVPRNVDPSVGAAGPGDAARHGHAQRVGGPGPRATARRSRWPPRSSWTKRSTATARPAASAAPPRSSAPCGLGSSRCARPSWSATGPSWLT